MAPPLRVEDTKMIVAERGSCIFAANDAILPKIGGTIRVPAAPARNTSGAAAGRRGTDSLCGLFREPDKDSGIAL